MLILVAVISAFLSATGVWLLRAAFRNRQQFLDQANERSLHVGTVPKVGGLAIWPCSVVPTMLYIGLFSDGESPRTAGFALQYVIPWVGCSAAIFVIAILNDRSKFGLRVLTRLLAYGSFAWIFSALSLQETKAPQACLGQYCLCSVDGSQAIILLAMTLIIIAFTNFFNFMDGMDGLAGSMGLIGFGCLAYLALRSQGPQAVTLACVCLAIAGACSGFLGWNWPAARVFMGDTGSTFLGFSAASLGWQGWLNESWHWSLPFIAFFPFWFDASATLLRRLARGEAVWLAHREHFYQHAVMSIREHRSSHLRVLIPAQVLMACSAAAAIWVQLEDQGVEQRALVALLWLLALHAAAAFLVERRLRLRSALDRNHRDTPVPPA